MKRVAYYIGMTSLFFALAILSVLFLGYTPLIIIPYVISLLLYDIVLLSYKSTSHQFKAFLNYDLIKLERLRRYDQKKLLTQTNESHLHIMTGLLYKEYSVVESRYTEYRYLTDLEQYYTSYLFEYTYLLKNEIESFLKLHKKYQDMSNKVFEDNIKTRTPGEFFADRRTYQISIEPLDMIYKLYLNQVTAQYVEEFRFKHNVYNMFKETGLYYYYINTEQIEKANVYLENTDFLFDQIQDETESPF